MADISCCDTGTGFAGYVINAGGLKQFNDEFDVHRTTYHAKLLKATCRSCLELLVCLLSRKYCFYPQPQVSGRAGSTTTSYLEAYDWRYAFRNLNRHMTVLLWLHGRQQSRSVSAAQYSKLAL